MGILKDASIKIRLLTLVAILVLSIIAVGVITYTAIEEMQRKGDIFMDMNDRARATQVEFGVQVQDWKNLLLRGADQEIFKKHKAGFLKHSSSIQENLSELQKMVAPYDQSVAAKVEALRNVHKELETKYMSALEQYSSTDVASPQVVDKLVIGTAAKQNEVFDEAVKLIQKLANEDIEANHKSIYTSLTVGILLIVLLSSIFAMFIIKSITGPINEITAFTQYLAQGRLDKRVTFNQKDELGIMADALNKSVAALEGVVANILSRTQIIDQTMQQIATGNEDLSKRTSGQAASLEQIAATIEQTTATIKGNAENSHEAQSLSNETSHIAEQGNQIVMEAIDAIEEINQSSKRIENIISVINEIAFQTNLLALNAAVEAARAGEQGKGFAVVAQEVRNLAQRSSEAAGEIQNLIKDSISRVERGTLLSRKSGEALGRITDSVRRVGEIIAEVAAASGEMSTGVQQVNAAIASLDNVTQQNAALVEENTASSAELSSQTNELLAMVQHFQITQPD